MDRLSRAAWMMILGGIVLAGRADAGLLDPLKFGSLGTLAVASGDFYTIDSSPAGGFTLTNGTTSYTGINFNGVAVFDFQSISIGTGAAVVANQGAAGLPIALLSRTTATIDGSIDVSAFANQPGPGASNGGVGSTGPGFPSLTSGGGGGGFGGAGGNGGSVFAVGTSSTIPGGPGGSANGNLALALRGGSFGASGNTSMFTGGMGGGAIELGATQSISLTSNGSITSFGGGASGFGSGGGSGGGIFLHAPIVSLMGDLEVKGGTGGNGLNSIVGGGGGGGGGQILVQFVRGGLTESNDTIGLSGGVGGKGTTTNTAGFNGQNGQTYTGQSGAVGANGTITFQAVPEPSSLALLGTSTLGLLGLALARRRAARRPGA